MDESATWKFLPRKILIFKLFHISYPSSLEITIEVAQNNIKLETLRWLWMDMQLRYVWCRSRPFDSHCIVCGRCDEMFQRLRGAFDDLSGYAIKVCLMLCSSRSFDNHCIVCGRCDEVVQKLRRLMVFNIFFDCSRKRVWRLPGSGILELEMGWLATGGMNGCEVIRSWER